MECIYDTADRLTAVESGTAGKIGCRCDAYGRKSQVTVSRKKNGREEVLARTSYQYDCMLDWADEYNVFSHGPEIHVNRPRSASNMLHFHIGKTGHIPII